MGGTFDKRTIIEKYENVQKGIGEMMSGALIETEARTFLNKGKAKAEMKRKRTLLLECCRTENCQWIKLQNIQGLILQKQSYLQGFRWCKKNADSFCS